MLAIQAQLRPAFYILLSLPATAMGLALCVQISALSWLLSTRYHLDLHEIGIVWAAGPLAGLLGQLAIGFASDRSWFLGGRRRPYILAGGMLAALMLFLLTRLEQLANLLGTHNLVWVALLTSLTLDLAINISFNPTRALIADVTPAGLERTRGYTWMQTISGFWGVLAYAISAMLGNDRLISIGMTLVLVFSMLPTLCIREPRTLAPAAGPAGPAALQPARPQGQFWRICAAHACSWAGVQAMFVYIIGFVRQYLAPAGSAPDEAGQTIAIAFAVMNCIGFLLPVLALAPLARKIGRVRTQAACTATMALGYLAIGGWCRDTATLYGLMVLLGIGWAAIVSLPFAIVSDHVGQHRLGASIGLFNLSIVVPQLLVSLLLGAVLEQAQDKSILFFICGGALALSSCLWLAVSETETSRAG